MSQQGVNFSLVATLCVRREETVVGFCRFVGFGCWGFQIFFLREVVLVIGC